MLLSTKVPPITQEVMQRLKKVFPGPRISPTSTIEQMKWDAAQKEVVDWIEREYWNGTPISVEPEEPVEPKPLPWWRRLLNRFRRK